MALTHAERQKQANKENIFISLTAHGQKKSSERENGVRQKTQQNPIAIYVFSCVFSFFFLSWMLLTCYQIEDILSWSTLSSRGHCAKDTLYLAQFFFKNCVIYNILYVFTNLLSYALCLLMEKSIVFG